MSTDTDSVLTVSGLTVELPKGTDRRHAIEEIDLHVGPREILCLVGESGSGKSVTAHSVMGLLPKDQLTAVAGSIRLEGEELRHATADRLRDLRCTRMSMIFQEPMTALNPVMSCGRQIDEVLQTHTSLDQPARTAKILDIMEQVHLPDPRRLFSSYPHQLSGGQRQRIMIAMALVLDPVLLIADEPTTALDVTTQAQILQLIKDLQERHDTGVLFITHDFGVVAEIADRVAVMQWGRIVEQGTTEQVLKRPDHPYTKMLISSVPSLVPRHRETRRAAPVVLRTEELAMTYSQGGMFQSKRSVVAAQDVNIEIRRGETLGIVGESGSGKTTVARCIARLIDPTGGRIYIDDDEIARVSVGQMRSHRRRIQIVFQDPYRSLNPRRMVGASIIEGPMNFGQPRDARPWRGRAS